MDESVINVVINGKVNVIKILTSPGPKLSRPSETFKKQNTFTPRFVQNGNLIYTCNLFTMNIPCEDGFAAIDMAEHLNGGIMKIAYKGADFAVPSLSAIGGMSTSAVFDVQKNESACQRKICESGCRDVMLPDEISDIAADPKTILITTKMMSESAPGEPMYGHPSRLMNMNSEFVSDIPHTKKIKIVDQGIFDYYVRVNIPAIYLCGTIEVLSSTFWNDILIQLVKSKGAWEVMKDRYDAASSPGFVIAKTPDVAMGVSLMEWPRGAIAFPPEIRYKEFENVNRWGIYQQLGSSKNATIKVPGGEYSWRIRFFFGPIWQVQEHINKIKKQAHGNEHKKLFVDQHPINKKYHEYAYPM
jgi:hypothetical protein